MARSRRSSALASLAVVCAVCLARTGAIPMAHGSLRRAHVRAAAVDSAAVSESSPDKLVLDAVRGVADEYKEIMATAMSQSDQESRGFDEQLKESNATVYDAMSKTQAAQACLATTQEKIGAVSAEIAELHKKRAELAASVDELRHAVELRNSARDGFLGQVGQWKDTMEGDSSRRLKELLKTGDAVMSAVQYAKDQAPAVLLEVAEEPLGDDGAPDAAAAAMPAALPANISEARMARQQLGDVGGDSWDKVYSSLGTLMAKYDTAKDVISDTPVRGIDLDQHDPMVQFNATLKTLDDALADKQPQLTALQQKLAECRGELTMAKQRLEAAAKDQERQLGLKTQMKAKYEKQTLKAHKVAKFADAAIAVLEDNIRAGTLNVTDLFPLPQEEGERQGLPSAQPHTVISAQQSSHTTHTKSSVTEFSVETSAGRR